MRRLSIRFTSVLLTLLTAPALTLSEPLGVVDEDQGTEMAAGRYCADVLVLAARGSGEKLDSFGGKGPIVAMVVGALESALPNRTITVKTLTGYPARPVASILKSPTGLKRFNEGVDDGVEEGLSLLKALAPVCPKQRLALVGYSQGAMVMHRILNKLEKRKPKIYSRAAGGVFVSDPDRVGLTKGVLTGEPVAPAWSGGISWSAIGGDDQPGQVGMEIQQVCTRGDLVCDARPSTLNKQGTKIHTAYAVVSPGLLTAAGQALADQLSRWPVPTARNMTHSAMVGHPTRLQLTADAYTGMTVEWSPTTALPPGMSLTPLGLLSGTPTQAGTWEVSYVLRNTQTTKYFGQATGPFFVTIEITDPPIRSSEVSPFTVTAPPLSYTSIWPASDGWWLTADRLSDTSWAYSWLSPTGARGPSWLSNFDPASVTAGPNGVMFVGGLDRSGSDTVQVVRVGHDGPEVAKMWPANPSTGEPPSVIMGRDGRLYAWVATSTGSSLRRMNPSTLETERSLGNSGGPVTATDDGLLLFGNGTSLIPYSSFSAANEGQSVPTIHRPSALNPSSDWVMSMSPDGWLARMTFWPRSCTDASISLLPPDGAEWVKEVADLLDVGTSCEVRDIDAKPGGGAVLTLYRDGALTLLRVDAAGNVLGETELTPEGDPFIGEYDATTTMDSAGRAHVAFTRMLACDSDDPGHHNGLCPTANLLQVEDGEVTAAEHFGLGTRSYVGGQGVAATIVGRGQVLTLVNQSMWSTFARDTEFLARAGFLSW